MSGLVCSIDTSVSFPLAKLHPNEKHDCRQGKQRRLDIADADGNQETYMICECESVYFVKTLRQLKVRVALTLTLNRVTNETLVMDGHVISPAKDMVIMTIRTTKEVLWYHVEPSTIMDWVSVHPWRPEDFPMCVGFILAQKSDVNVEEGVAK